MLDNLLKISKIGLIVVLVISVIDLTDASLRFIETTEITQRNLVSQVKNISSSMSDATHEGIHVLNTRLKGFEKTLDYRVASSVKTLDKRLASVEASGLLISGTYLNAAQEAVTQLSPTIKVINLAAEQSAPFLNCKSNNGCAQITMMETLQAGRAAGRDVSRLAFTMNKEIPEITSNVIKISDSVASTSKELNTTIPKISHNTEQITASINRMLKKKWWEKVLSYGLTGAIAYGAAK